MQDLVCELLVSLSSGDNPRLYNQAFMTHFSELWSKDFQIFYLDRALQPEDWPGMFDRCRKWNVELVLKIGYEIALWLMLCESGLLYGGLSHQGPALGRAIRRSDNPMPHALKLGITAMRP